MLEIDTEVERGILFMKLDGVLNQSSFPSFGNKINSLLYNYGFQYFVFDFSSINTLDDDIFFKIQNKLIEIFLNCGKVVISGLGESIKNKIGYTKNNLYYVDKRLEAFKYLCL